MVPRATVVVYGAVTAAVESLRDSSGVLFDFNGTLSDDERILEQLFIELAAEAGVFLTQLDYRTGLAGRSDPEIAQAILARTASGAPSLKDFLLQLDQRYMEEVSRTSTITEETRALVRELHKTGIPLGIVTGAGRPTVLPALERAGLDGLFDVVITQEDVQDGKPHPEGLNRAAAALGLPDPSTVVVFEDSLPGLTAVMAAGMVPIAVAGTHPESELLQRAVVVLDRLGPDLIHRSLQQS